MSLAGKLVLIKRGDGGTPTELFAAVSGLRTKSASLNNEPIDVTNDDSNGWRELLDQEGVKNFDISGGGVIKNQADQRAIVADLISGALHNYQFDVPGIGVFEAAFKCTSFDPAGEYNGEANFSMAFQSSGEVTFTAAS